jgi:hypothetical protein
MDSFFSNPTAIGALVVVIYILGRLVEFLVKKYMNNNPSKSVLTPQEHDWLKTLYDQHNKYDQDGTPIWYVPRSLSETQEDIVKALMNIAKQQEKTTYILEQIIKQIDKMDDD